MRPDAGPPGLLRLRREKPGPVRLRFAPSPRRRGGGAAVGATVRLPDAPDGAARCAPPRRPPRHRLRRGGSCWPAPACPRRRAGGRQVHWRAAPRVRTGRACRHRRRPAPRRGRAGGAWADVLASGVPCSWRWWPGGREHALPRSPLVRRCAARGSQASAAAERLAPHRHGTTPQRADRRGLMPINAPSARRRHGGFPIPPENVR